MQWSKNKKRGWRTLFSSAEGTEDSLQCVSMAMRHLGFFFFFNASFCTPKVTEKISLKGSSRDNFILSSAESRSSLLRLLQALIWTSPWWKSRSLFPCSSVWFFPLWTVFVCLISNWNSLRCELCALPSLILLLCHSEKSVFITVLWKTSGRFCPYPSKADKPSSFSFSLYVMCDWWLPVWRASMCQWFCVLETVIQMQPHKYKVWGSQGFSHLLAVCSLAQPNTQLAFAARLCCCVLVV